ncbi:MAG TPA: 50S ribosomal protein L6 [Thermohalobaculum sp.]|nr:50S ribosomal protein L6 [Thermohalobaculum sp.]
MSRIGKRPVELPSGVSAEVKGQTVEVKGPKGQRSFTATDDVDVVMEDNAIRVTPRGPSKRARQQWGMTRTQVANLVHGVTEGFRKDLAINGVGYRAQVQGKTLKLALGYSHDVDFEIPDGIDIKTPKPTEIEISGIDQQQVGQVAAKIRGWRPPEPYKGKGVKYREERIFRKEGKKK